MSNQKLILALCIFCTAIVFASATLATAQIENLAVGYSSLAGHHTPMWIAVEERIGRKYGIELKDIYAGRLRPQQLLVSGDVPIVVAINMNKVGGGIFAKSEIKTPEDLRGKIIGASRAGSISEVILRYVLRAKLGIQPDRDVKMLVVGDPAIELQALERGIVDATPLTMPCH